MRRRIAATLVAALAAALLPAAAAQAAPEIKLLNPSALAAGSIPEISDKGGRPVHLVAWASEVPANPIVEFEVKLLSSPLPGAGQATIDGQQVTTDTWQGNFAITNAFPEGTYEVRAILYSNLEEVAAASQNVTLNRSDIPPAADTIEMSEPVNGGTLGFSQSGDQAVMLLRGNTTDSTEQVQAFYTLSAPGKTPEWKACGSTEPASDGSFTMRCTTAANDPGSGVRAVAVVANRTPAPGPPQRGADDGMDAHRVNTYQQIATAVPIDPNHIKTDVNRCLKLTATVVDQNGAPMPGVNVDVHATGPNDQLRFGTLHPTPVTTETSGFQNPNQAHSSDEAGVNCSNGENENRQGDHNRPGLNDTKHIESTAGTNNQGRFVFALLSGVGGSTQVTAWADTTQDDVQGASEATGGAVVGWGVDPEPPARQLLIDPDGSSAQVGSCQRVVAALREGGSPVAGQNLDVHISGPDAAVSFCPVADGSPAREPDAGGHTGNAHSDGDKHLEGETDSAGRLIFGVLSATQGETDILVWQDNPDDDELSLTIEPSQTATLTWVASGARDISLDASSRSVPKGKRVRLFGDIEGDEGCTAVQQVIIKRRRPDGRFRTLTQTVTGEDGSYSLRTRVRRTYEYRAIAPAEGDCDRAVSRIVKVRARG